jgi:hypothetical protein
MTYRLLAAFLVALLAACTPSQSQTTPPTNQPTQPTQPTQATEPPQASNSGDAEIKTETFSVALDDVTTAKIIIDVPFEKVFISALAESDNLVEAEVEYVGEMTFTADRGSVTLRESTAGESYTGDKPLRWNILVSPEVELVLEIEVASGEVSLDASGLNMSMLTLDAASGTIDADLATIPLSITVEVSSGEINVNMPQGADVNVTRVDVSSGAVGLNLGADSDVRVEGVTIGSGQVVVDVAQETAVRLDVQNVASGTVNIAYRMTRLDGTGSDEGMWETDGYSVAEHHVSLLVESISSGTFELE